MTLQHEHSSRDDFESGDLGLFAGKIEPSIRGS